MRLSKSNKDTKIVELYKSGWSYRQLQKRYHLSPNHIARLVQGIEVTCTACGKPKGKVRFHAHHPDRVNHPDYTIPLCPSCHAKEEAKIRREKENPSRSPMNPIMPTKENIAIKPENFDLSFTPGPLSPTQRRLLTSLVIVWVLEKLLPGFFERRWQEIQAHWRGS
jgi:hypothetical protein